MTEECPHCGQRLRQGWRLCPKCRKPSESPSGMDASEPLSRAWRWSAVAAVLGVALGGFVLVKSRAVERVELATPALADTNGRLTAASQSADLTAAIGKNQQAIDSVRAGGAAYTQGDLSTAQRAFEAAVIASPDNGAARNNLGQVLVRQGRAADALPHFDAAVRLSPREWSYRFNRARAYGELNRLQDALTEYEAAEAFFPDDHPTLFNHGLILMRLRRYDDATGVLERAVSSTPEDPDLLITLGTAQVGAGKAKDARITFERFLERAPGHPEAPRVKALLEAMAAAGQ